MSAEQLSEAPAHVQRLKVEADELRERTAKLAAFIGSSTYQALSFDERYVLDKQLNAMEYYLSILQYRLAMENLL